jgi:endogenous inhibitor of DNA gyrase (YacG/DUF329 family)
MKSVPCPTCKTAALLPSENSSFPFCTPRCKLLDLGRWLEGAYAINPATGALEVIDPDEAQEVEFEH